MSITRTLKKNNEQFYLHVNGALATCPFQANYNLPVQSRIQKQAMEMQNVRYGCGSTCPLFETTFRSTACDVTINCGSTPIEYRDLSVEESQPVEQPGPKLIRG